MRNALSLPEIKFGRIDRATSEVRVGHNAANRLNSTRRWRILVQR